MKTSLKVFAIIGIVFMGIALLGNLGNATDFGYTLLVVAVWMPLCILTLVNISKEKDLLIK